MAPSAIGVTDIDLSKETVVVGEAGAEAIGTDVSVVDMTDVDRSLEVEGWLDTENAAVSFSTTSGESPPKSWTSAAIAIRSPTVRTRSVERFGATCYRVKTSWPEIA